MTLKLSSIMIVAVAALGCAAAACNAILGNEDHDLAPSVAVDGGGSGDDDGSITGQPDATGDATEEPSPGGPVPPTSGGIYSVGRVPSDGGVGQLPDGAVAAVIDDGFEFGEALCNGTTCVTGDITP